MDMRPAKPYRSTDLDSWLRWSGVVYLLLLALSQMAPQGPGVTVFLVTLVFGLPVAAMGGLLLMTCWQVVKIIFE